MVWFIYFYSPSFNINVIYWASLLLRPPNDFAKFQVSEKLNFLTSNKIHEDAVLILISAQITTKMSWELLIEFKIFKRKFHFKTPRERRLLGWVSWVMWCDVRARPGSVVSWSPSGEDRETERDPSPPAASEKMKVSYCMVLPGNKILNTDDNKDGWESKKRIERAQMLLFLWIPFWTTSFTG